LTSQTRYLTLGFLEPVHIFHSRHADAPQII
jgi:hypothetical protein